MANESTNPRNFNPSTYWLAPARNFRTSARLHLQHLLFQNTLGYLLEPHVQNYVEETTATNAKQLRIADLACGNGVWLLDVARELSDKGVSAQLDGYDVNSVNFPSPAFLPQSVTFKKLDILAKPLPEELIGAYDVVHIRAFVSIIINEDTTPFLSSVLALLKPGGWVQWEEMRADTPVAHPHPNVQNSACETMARIIKTGGESRGLKFEFVAELDRHLKEHSFDDVYMRVTQKRKEDYKGWTEDFLMVWEELGQHFPSKEDQPQAPLTREFWADLFSKAVAETEQGTALHHDKIVTAVGRKASQKLLAWSSLETLSNGLSLNIAFSPA
ncbi:hypothetical protein F5Y04DRAFT_266301 [Hypomontagnella monticulosa]|nr:hypothetical protein F5Y04DRAFT_266301 [Hypomontagnella monticulosa]